MDLLDDPLYRVKDHAILKHNSDSLEGLSIFELSDFLKIGHALIEELHKGYLVQFENVWVLNLNFLFIFQIFDSLIVFSEKLDDLVSIGKPLLADTIVVRVPKDHEKDYDQ